MEGGLAWCSRQSPQWHQHRDTPVRRFHCPGEEVRQRSDEAGQNHQGPSMLRKGIGVNAEAEGKPPGRVEAGQ